MKVYVGSFLEYQNHLNPHDDGVYSCCGVFMLKEDVLEAFARAMLYRVKTDEFFNSNNFDFTVFECTIGEYGNDNEYGLTIEELDKVEKRAYELAKERNDV